MATNLCSVSKNLSHPQREDSLNASIQKIVEKVKERKDLPHVSVQRQLELIDLLAQFGLGRFLLERGGLNGYWTNYVIKHPLYGRLTGLNDENKPFNFLERFLLDQAPTALATQQRFEIFKKEIQQRLRREIALASIPCGLMADLADLDFTNAPDASLTGIDLDVESIELAKRSVSEAPCNQRCSFLQIDAWNLQVQEEFDLMTSNGLAIYEPDDEKVIELYQRFFAALKPKGCLVTSFLTPQSEWKRDAINMEHALLQKVVFADILDGKWQIFRSEATVESQLRLAGFSQIELIYDVAHIFPTVIAKKSGESNL